MNDTHQRFIDKELSWLSFNERVLQEAGNPKVPEIQRLRYLGIFSNNLDEFFRVRVADVSRLAEFSSASQDKERYKELLYRIQDSTRRLQNQFDQTYSEVLAALRKRKIYLVSEQQLDNDQRTTASEIFTQSVLPELDPILLESNKPFPEITDGMIYLAIKLTHSDNNYSYGIVEIPTDRLPRFIQIPKRKGGQGKVFIVLENIMRCELARIFRGVIDFVDAEAYTFKITRDAELELGDGINQSLLDRLSQSLRRRRHADPERLVYDAKMPKDLLDLLIKRLELNKYDSIMPGSRYHNAKDFMDFPAVGPNYLELKQLPTLPVPELDGYTGNIFNKIKETDILLYFPYQPFSVVVDLLKTAAIDPAVKTIQICLYRVAKNSKIVDALLSARRNNKEVTAVVELQARFDEAANIDWSQELTAGGVNVIFGVPGLKVHSKLILIGRQEGPVLKYYSHVGTGNLNEKTAGIYTDFSLLTYNQDIGQDLSKVFDFINYTYRRHHMQELLVSPHTNRAGITELIQTETENANQGLPATITLKCNNLVDQDIIEALYTASQAGVRIRIICRGMMSLIPGVPGMSDKIEAISIIDRYLEHPRVFVFHNAGQPKYFISSSDLMTRNLDHRVEVTTPILDPRLQKILNDIIDIQWCDNVKARILDEDQANTFRRYKINGKIRSQEIIHQYLQEGKLPDNVKSVRKRWDKEINKEAKARKAAIKKTKKKK